MNKRKNGVKNVLGIDENIYVAGACSRFSLAIIEIDTPSLF
jgi:hypothetical protein